MVYIFFLNVKLYFTQKQINSLTIIHYISQLLFSLHHLLPKTVLLQGKINKPNVIMPTFATAG